MRRAGGEEVLVAVNLSNQPFAGLVEGGGPGYADVTPDTRPPLAADATPAQRAARTRTVGLPALALDAWGYRIFRRTLR